MVDLALVLELHHPLPGPGENAGPDWATRATETYWPLLRAVDDLGNRHIRNALTLAISPAWTALACDPVAREMTLAAIERAGAASDAGRELGRFAVGRWNLDALALLRHAQNRGAVELIPTTASPTWLPAIAHEPILAHAQVCLAEADHRRKLGAPPSGIWLPFLSYLPGIESIFAKSSMRFFAVGDEAFPREGALHSNPPSSPVITPPGVAAFAVSPVPTQLVTDRARRYARDPRYSDPNETAAAIADHAAHFVSSWRDFAKHAAANDNKAISLAAISSRDLSDAWPAGARWFAEVLRRLTGAEQIRPTTPSRYLDRHPEGPLGCPGPTTFRLSPDRARVFDLLDRCRGASGFLVAFVAQRERLGPLGRRALAQITRALLQALRLDDQNTETGEGGFDRAERYLAQFQELAGSLVAGRLDPSRLARLECGPAYLPEIDLELLGVVAK